MANCNDCICSEVCYYKSFNDVRNLKKRRTDVEKICKSFVHRDRLKNAPTVDAVEVKHGHWVSLTECSNAGVYCSVCNKKVYKEDYAWCNRKNKLRSNYCPNCGAKMDGERKEKNEP